MYCYKLTCLISDLLEEGKVLVPREKSLPEEGRLLLVFCGKSMLEK